LQTTKEIYQSLGKKGIKITHMGSQDVVASVVAKFISATKILD